MLLFFYIRLFGFRIFYDTFFFSICPSKSYWCDDGSEYDHSHTNSYWCDDGSEYAHLRAIGVTIVVNMTMATTAP